MVGEDAGWQQAAGTADGAAVPLRRIVEPAAAAGRWTRIARHVAASVGWAVAGAALFGGGFLLWHLLFGNSVGGDVWLGQPAAWVQEAAADDDVVPGGTPLTPELLDRLTIPSSTTTATVIETTSTTSSTTSSTTTVAASSSSTSPSTTVARRAPSAQTPVATTVKPVSSTTSVPTATTTVSTVSTSTSVPSSVTSTSVASTTTDVTSTTVDDDDDDDEDSSGRGRGGRGSD